MNTDQILEYARRFADEHGFAFSLMYTSGQNPWSAIFISSQALVPSLSASGSTPKGAIEHLLMKSATALLRKGLNKLEAVAAEAIKPQPR